MPGEENNNNRDLFRKLEFIMKRNLILEMFMAATLACCLQSARAEIWNASDQFSTTSNTAADTWQYFWAAGDGSNNAGYNLFAQYDTSGTSAPGYPVWDNNAQWHFIGKNASVYDGLLAHPFGYPPANLPPYIVAVGWKSPIDGVVDADFSLLDLNAGEGDGQAWALFKSGATTPLASGTLDNGGNTGLLHVSNVPVAAGDMLYLQVGCRADFVGDLTGVQFQVTSVPEPGIFALMSCAAMGLMAYGWKKRR
jgi:hypothetical protein